VTCRDLVRFALAALGGHPLRTALTLLGVAIGVASVILLTSLGEGARLYVTGEFASLGTNLLIVVPGKTETTGAFPVTGGVPNDLTLEDAEWVRRRVRQVRRLAPIALGTANARHGERSREVTVVGTTAEMRPIRRITMRSGRFLPGGSVAEGQRVCVIGASVQRELFPGTNPLGQALRLGEYRYRIIGTAAPRGVTVGMNLDEMVYVPVSQALDMLNRRGLFRMFVEVGSHAEMESTRAEILAVLAERHDGTEDVTILTQDAVIATFGKIFAILTAALGGIAAVSLSVAGLGIMNVMLVSVAERTAEIGLLKALGASPGQVLAAFLVEATLLSAVGSLLGLAAGYGAGWGLAAAFPALPVEPPAWAVAGVLALSLTVGMLFGALPARRAARLDPVASLARR
jgi:putative ABC transport system permease protein